MTVALVACLAMHFVACGALLRTKVVNDLLVISLVYLIVFWYVLPGLLVLMYPYETLSPFISAVAGLNESVFFYSYAAESVALCLIVGLFLLAHRNSVNQRDSASGVQLSDRPEFRLVVWALAIIVLARATSGQFNYMENNDASAAAGGSTSVLYLVGSILECVCVAVISQQRRWTLIMVAAFLLVSAFAALDAYAGARFTLVKPMVILSFKYFRLIKMDWRTIAVCAGGLGFLVYVIIPLTFSIGAQRGSGEVQLARTISETGNAISKADVATLLFAKLDSYSTGVVLTRPGPARGMGAAGFAPYVGSALVFIPRALWPARPVAGSIDGTIFGHPSRIVPASLVSTIAPSLNMGIAPLHITYWEFGYIGFPAFVAAGVFFLTFVNNLLLAPTLIGRALGVYLLGLPNFYFLLPSPDVMVMKSTMVIGIFMVFLTLRDTWRYHRSQLSLSS